jgi:hypothetical protein
MRLTRAGALVAAAAIAASCAPRPAPPASAPPPPIRRPLPPAPAPPPPPAAADWRDRPLAPGDWSYSGQSGIHEATFASPGGALFAMRCTAAGQIVLMRPGVSGGALTIVTSFGERVIAGAGGADQATASLAASDPLFDQMVFSRGRFLVRTAQGGDLILPAWPEPARVIEECRA